MSDGGFGFPPSLPLMNYSTMDDMGMPGEETGNSPGESETPPVSETGTPSENQTVMLSADMLGEAKPKKGDQITFVCTGDPDSEGNVSGYFEPVGEGASDAGEGKETWEDQFQREMSPRNGEQ